MRRLRTAATEYGGKKETMSGPYDESGMRFIRSMEAFDRRHGISGYSRGSLRLLETLNAISPTAYERTLLSNERALRESLVEHLQNIQPYIDAWSRIADVPYLEDLARLTAQWDALTNFPVDSDYDDSTTVELSNEFKSALTSVAPYVSAEQKGQYEKAVQQASEKRITRSDAIALLTLLATLIIGILQLLSAQRADQSNDQILESNQQVVESNLLVVESNQQVVESNLQVVDAIHELLRVNVELAEAIYCDGDSPVLDEQDNSLNYHNEQ